MAAPRPSRLVIRDLSPRGLPPVPQAPAESAWPAVTSVLAAADEIDAGEAQDELLRRAVQVIRGRIGLERVGFYMRDRSSERAVLRGTWGTGLDGETTDEHALHHELSDVDYEILRRLQSNGALWLYRDSVPYVVEEREQTIVVGQGWLAVTPLIFARDLLGVMYNDAARTGQPLDEQKQAQAALLCSLLARTLAAQRETPAWPPLGRELEGGSLVSWVQSALDADPSVTGDSLARQLGISPGYLARSFKNGTGRSLVEYRNRLRIERFFEAVNHGQKSLLRAALDAGFGSYAQFHRVYRKLFGATPREHLPGRGAERSPGDAD